MFGHPTAQEEGDDDFAVPPEHQQVVEAVRACVRDDVLPVAAQVRHPGELEQRWELVEDLLE